MRGLEAAHVFIFATDKLKFPLCPVNLSPEVNVVDDLPRDIDYVANSTDSLIGDGKGFPVVRKA